MTSQEFNNWVVSILDPHTVMLAISQGKYPRADGVIANGTGVLISTGKAELLITNYDVYDFYINKKREEPTTLLVMSGSHNSPFVDISNANVRASDDRLDLAILMLPLEVVQRSGNRYLLGNSWPPERPKEGMHAVIYGYPGQARRPMGQNMGAGAIAVGLRVTEVQAECFVAGDPEQTGRTVSPEGAPELSDWGGMSGSLVLAGTLPNLSMSGIMRKGGPGLIFGKHILATHLDFINADGSIRTAGHRDGSLEPDLSTPSERPAESRIPYRR